MVVDTSALLAILLEEPDAARLALAVESAPIRLMSSVNQLEASIVIESKKGEFGGLELDLLIRRSQIRVVSFTEELAELARAAWRQWGKGRNPAGLNFCDCCAYALSVQSGLPLLYKGDDFRKTDVVSWLEG